MYYKAIKEISLALSIYETHTRPHKAKREKLLLVTYRIGFEDFEDWAKVAELIKSKAHLTEGGVEKIREIKSGMNTLRSIGR